MFADEDEKLRGPRRANVTSRNDVGQNRNAGVRAAGSQGPSHEVSQIRLPRAAPQCGIGSPERPTGIVEGNKYDTSIAAEIITGKFSYHMPIYRQQDYFAGSGWTPGRSTLLNILTGCFFVIEPLLAYFKRTLPKRLRDWLRRHGVTLLYPKRSRNSTSTIRNSGGFTKCLAKALEDGKPSINAKMWAYRGASIKLNLFDFTVSRHRDGPELFFADYSGTLLGDCWHGFESIALASSGADRACCLQ